MRNIDLPDLTISIRHRWGFVVSWGFCHYQLGHVAMVRLGGRRRWNLDLGCVYMQGTDLGCVHLQDLVAQEEVHRSGRQGD
jgi:hypothetical protein